MTYQLIEYLILLIYGSISTFAMIGAILYFDAFLKMKKSNMILSVSILLFTIGIDALWWFFVEFSRFINDVQIYSICIINPIGIIIVKIITFIGIVYFVKTSVSVPNEKKGDIKNTTS